MITLYINNEIFELKYVQFMACRNEQISLCDTLRVPRSIYDITLYGDSLCVVKTCVLPVELPIEFSLS
jgi:hypothetical protein